MPKQKSMQIVGYLLTISYPATSIEIYTPFFGAGVNPPTQINWTLLVCQVNVWAGNVVSLFDVLREIGMMDIGRYI